jgi:hypothetical protein
MFFRFAKKVETMIVSTSSNKTESWVRQNLTTAQKLRLDDSVIAEFHLTTHCSDEHYNSLWECPCPL